MSFVLDASRKKEAETLLRHYPTKRAALLPLLWLVHQQEGYISEAAINFICDFLNLKPAEVWGVVTFYTMFQRKPIGKHHIQVCTNLCCRLRGADMVLEHLKERLEIDVGETTKDGKFHLSTVECLGSCGTAPMMQIDNDYYEDLTERKINSILSSFK